MVKVCEHLQNKNDPCGKRGFGIVEALVAAAVLGFMYMAILHLQEGNHDALLRIRGRDGATEVAQNLIDSLGALGVASLSDDNLPHNADGDVDYTIGLTTVDNLFIAGTPTIIEVEDGAVKANVPGKNACLSFLNEQRLNKNS